MTWCFNSVFNLCIVCSEYESSLNNSSILSSRSSSLSSSSGREVFLLFPFELFIFAINEGDEVEEDDAGDAEFIFVWVVLSIKRTIGGWVVWFFESWLVTRDVKRITGAVGFNRLFKWELVVDVDERFRFYSNKPTFSFIKEKMILRNLLMNEYVVVFD